jgi:hypothetical protein
MCSMAGTASAWAARHDEVKRYLSVNRRGLRGLAVAQCERDSRFLGAVYQLKDGLWLWHQGSRPTPEEIRRECLENVVDEYETLIENGEDRADAWRVTLGAIDERLLRFSGRSKPLPRIDKLGDLANAMKFYRTVPLADAARLDRDLRGEFCSCPKCRLTYLVEYSAMCYAAGKSVVDRNGRQVIVIPGRVLAEGADPRLAAAPAYGLIRSWQATPWRLVSPS